MPFRVRTRENPQPGVVVATAPRPRATICNPFRIKIHGFIILKDPRYVERTWKESEIESELTVGRTVLGSGLDSLADRLLEPAKE